MKAKPANASYREGHEAIFGKDDRTANERLLTPENEFRAQSKPTFISAAICPPKVHLDPLVQSALEKRGLKIGTN